MGLTRSLLMSDTGVKVFSASCLGPLLHTTVFIHGEWHMHAPSLVSGHLFVMTLLCALEYYIGSLTIEIAARITTLMSVSYFATLLCSIAAYRVFFHRLRRFPGPTLAKVSKWWHVLRCLDSSNHLFLHSCYQKYGDFVRTGPEELTVFHPEIHQLLDAYSSSAYKAEWYDITRPNYSVMTTRNKDEHKERRKLWEHGFHVRSLEDYEKRSFVYVQQVLAKIEVAAQEQSVLDITRLLYWFGWDVMGDVTFGQSFGMLDSETWHRSVAVLKGAMRFLGLISPMPWLARLAFAYLARVWIVKDWFDFIEFCRERLRERSQKEMMVRDISGWLIDSSEQRGRAIAEDEWITGDTVLAIIAGSDTVTAALVALFYRLAEDSARADHLYELVKDIDVADRNALQGVTYLDALIQETLRLHHPLPTGGPRKTGPDGLLVGDTFIPGNVTVIGPRYSLGRHMEAFVHAEDFIPERWTTRPELVADPALFIPFGTGRHVCTGKNLAIAEMRQMTAAVIQKFAIVFPENSSKLNPFDSMKDHVTPTLGALPLVFQKRASQRQMPNDKVPQTSEFGAQSNMVEGNTSNALRKDSENVNE